VVQKFNKITTPCASAAQRSAIADAVANLEQISVGELMKQLGGVTWGSNNSDSNKPS